MSFFVYLFVLLITASSMLFGLDWLSAPMSPMPPGKPAIQTANRPASPPTPVRAVAAPVKAAPPAVPRPVEPVEAAPTPIVVPAPVEVAVPVIAEEPSGATASGAEPEKAAAPAPPQCDVNACTAAYRSFTAADCTYQPSNGPRRLCTRGEVPSIAVDPAVAANARAQTCNINACAAAYGSFDASDCTYQPYDGPRRLCTK